MAGKTESHKRAQSKAAGKQGKTEVLIKGNRRLDAKTKVKASEVERSDDTKRLVQAARRLRVSGMKQKILQVPQQNMDKAANAMKTVKVKGTVKNMSGTKRRSV